MVRKKLFPLNVIVSVFMAFIICGSTTKAAGADWTLYAETGNFYFYADSSSIKSSVTDYFSFPWTKTVKAWVKRVVKNEHGRNWQIQENKKLNITTRGYENYEYTVSLIEMNCTDKSRRLLADTDYSKGGDILAASEEPYARWKPVTPESANELLFQVLCGKPKTPPSDKTGGDDKHEEASQEQPEK